MHIVPNVEHYLKAMKKTIRKPENWQDFESLCKKLWGEIWGVSSKIKKNGRLGQPQAGVDVFAKPKGENEYWGIQCKGKDDYTNAKLTKSEIDTEIEKAKFFNPKLKVFIVATTANKDAEIEEFIRIKDIENQKEYFEVLLYCWEDIADLIEENRETFNWYVNEIEFREKFDFDLFFNDFTKELTIQPKFKKYIKSYQVKPKFNYSELLSHNNLPSSLLVGNFQIFNPSISNTINRAWCDFNIVFKNLGNKVIEDWKLRIDFKSGIREIYNPCQSLMTMISNGISLDSLKSRTTFIYKEDKRIRYFPLNNAPLIQKDKKFIEVSVLPDKFDDKIIIEWELLARDFNRKGKLEIKIEPIYTTTEIVHNVESEDELIDDEIEIFDLIEEIKNNV